ncbi:MAG: S-layer homology domain-containing protein [Candidatus Gracilibacteria bacterium]|nr:S-layer homology domain-containing protein [Candidatus Gracilibacteria bacterium]
MKKFTSLFAILAILAISPIMPSLADDHTEMDDMSDKEIIELITEEKPEINFPDVKEGDWYFPFVKELFDQGLMEGYPDGRFGAWDPINRAEFAKVIVKLQDQIREPWYERHLISLVLVAINIFGWVLIMAALGRKGHQDVNVNVQVPSQERSDHIVSAPSTKKPQPISEKESPLKEQSPVEAKNDQNNWWNK